ncbi:MAG: glycosyltransferase family 39 protein, partial [Candidatus Spechtbacteria bacterium]|nr:glycosyltransferase family 39 protein [Candidatus Spechtbacteria bacterium]
MVRFFRSHKEISKLALLILVFLIVKLALFLPAYMSDQSRVFMGDSYLYQNSAQTLLKLGRFSQSLASPDAPQIVLTPGYPLFLAKIYSLFGIHNLPVILAQILLSAASLLLAYALARKFLHQRIAFIAIVFLALDPASFVNSFLLLTETLFTFLLLLAAYAGVELLQNERNSKAWAFALGVTLAFSTHVRPIAYYLIFPALTGFFLIFLFRKFPWRKTFPILALILIPWILLVGGWHIRNFSITKSFTFSHIQGINLFDYKAPDIIARRDGI